MHATATPVVLVVDDEADIRTMLSLVLQARGFSVITAADGFEALSILEGLSPIDAVLLDERMPVMSGSDVLVQLRAIPHRSYLPVVCISAFGADGHAQRMIDLGADAFLPKPFSIVDLVAVLQHAISDTVLAAGA